MYNSQADANFVPHGTGMLAYENDFVKEGEWRNGRYSRNAIPKEYGDERKATKGRVASRERSQSSSLIIVPVEGE